MYAPPPDESASYREVKASTPYFIASHMRDYFDDLANKTWRSGGPQYSKADSSLRIPVLHLIDSLSVLNDLTFNFWNKFPPEILDAFRSKYPSCRVHIGTFQLSSLYGWDAPRLSPLDLALVTSPCINSISAGYCYINDAPQPEYHNELVMDLARGLAPGLKSVRLFHYAPAACLGTSRDRPKWRGFGVGERQDGPILPILNHLALEGCDDI
jgi:hypothetical protein